MCRYYFAHDITASKDLKLQCLRAVHKMEGIGIYWSLLELLAETCVEMDCPPRMQLAPYLLCAMLGISTSSASQQRLESVIRDFRLFVIETDDYGREFFYSRRLSERFHRDVVERSDRDEQTAPTDAPFPPVRKLSAEARAKMAQGGKKSRRNKVDDKVDKVTDKVDKVTDKVEPAENKVESKVTDKVDPAESKVDDKVDPAESKVDDKVDKVDAPQRARGAKSPKEEKIERDREEEEEEGATPSKAEVEAFFAAEGLAASPARFFAYYQRRGWRSGDNPIRSWRALARQWSERHDPVPPEVEKLPTHRRRATAPVNDAYAPRPHAVDELAEWLSLSDEDRDTLRRLYPDQYPADRFPDPEVQATA